MSFSDEVVVALQDWHQARESANRHNRNLLQYGVALSALFGIEAGFGGIVAVAIRVRPGGGTPFGVAAVILGAAGIVLGALLAVAIVRAFRERQVAEELAAEMLPILIRHDPERFMPREELTRDLGAESE